MLVPQSTLGPTLPLWPFLCGGGYGTCHPEISGIFRRLLRTAGTGLFREATPHLLPSSCVRSVVGRQQRRLHGRDPTQHPHIPTLHTAIWAALLKAWSPSGNVSTAQELGRDADSQASAQTYCTRNSGETRGATVPSGDSRDPPFCSLPGSSGIPSSRTLSARG